jgi:hypothetical protein
MSGAGQPQAANRAAASLRHCLYGPVSIRPPFTLADALFEPWLGPARADVPEGSAAAIAASVEVVK